MKKRFLNFYMRKDIIVTGAAGFIGFHLCKRLIKNNYRVIGIDRKRTDDKRKKFIFIDFFNSCHVKENKFK